jgi:hypothetical protein
MSCESLRKINEKIKEAKVNSREPPVIPSGKRVHRKKLLSVICLLTIVVFGAVIATIGSSKTFVYASSVSGFGAGIYWDQACTNKTIALNWGTIEPGSNNTLTIYIRNEGNSPASLSLETSNWTPSTSIDYMSLNWNYSGQVLSADQVISLVLTLTVSPTIIGINNFSCDTIITASES